VKRGHGHPAKTLWLLLVLFGARVLGQGLVAWLSPPFLPPMAQWHSGLIPYPLLLASQVLIIGLLVKICRDVARGKGFWGDPRPAFGRWLITAGLVYLGAMLIRYGIRMWLLPHARWMGGTIPIFFHGVLACFLLRLGFYHLRATSGGGD
jgi:hypothetical protein